MLRPEKMEMIRVTGLHRDIDRVLDLLHRSGCVELRRVGEDVLEKFEMGKPLDIFSKVSEQLVRLRGIESVLKPREVEPREKLELDEMFREAESLGIDDEVREIQLELENIRERERELLKMSEVVEELSVLGIDFSVLEVESVDSIAGMMVESEFSQFIDALGRITTRFDYLSAVKKKKTVIFLIVFDKKLGDHVHKLLEEYSHSILDIPPIKGSPSRVKAEIERELAELDERKKQIDARVEALSDKYFAKVATLREMFEIEAEKAEAPMKFAREEHIFMMTGWIPSKKRRWAEEKLNEITNGRILVEKIETDELPPTLLNNPRPIKSMEFLVGFFSWPKSNEWDPTILVAITFPIFYGMMLGDIGYALATLGVAVLLIKKFGEKYPSLRYLGEALVITSAVTVIFGIIYGEFFGHEIGHPLFERLHRVDDLLVITILVGVFHVSFGLLLGIINTWNHKEYEHMLSKIGWLLILYGGIILVYQFLGGGSLTEPTLSNIVGFALVGAGLVLELKTEGPMSIMEVPSLASFVLSYTRILGVGLVSFILAFVLNTQLSNALATGSPKLIALVFLIFIVGHLVNFLLGIFEPFLQGIRLHYVEFFSKFYEGNGILFSPFKHISKYVKYGEKGS
jgi:V/A-type H+-transporting ATPase subunit I